MFSASTLPKMRGVGTATHLHEGKNAEEEVKIFVKWGFDSTRIAQLMDEARLYASELKGAQGSAVPIFYGLLADSPTNPTFAVSLFEAVEPAHGKLKSTSFIK